MHESNHAIDDRLDDRAPNQRANAAQPGLCRQMEFGSQLADGFFDCGYHRRSASYILVAE